MDSVDALSYALGLPGAFADNPFGHDMDLAKVGGRIFLFPSGGDAPASISVKNTAEKVEELKHRYPGHVGPAPYLDKRLWARVQLSGLPDEEIRELIEDSYDLVVAGLPKSKRPAGS